MSDLRTLTAVMHPWKNAQCPMGETKRWGNFPDYGQNLLMHNNSVPWVAEWVISEVSRTHAIDQALLYRAFIVHDHGEPLTGGDEHIDAQTDDKEIKEWAAFVELIKGVRPEMKDRLLRAFALQYARKKQTAQWSEQLVILANTFATSYRVEAVVFDFSEKLDYLFTAYDGHLRGVKNKDEHMLAHALRHNVPKLNAMCEELSALKRIWTNTLQDELHSLAVGH